MPFEEPVPVLEETTFDDPIELEGPPVLREKGPREAEFDGAINVLSATRESRFDQSVDLMGIAYSDTEIAAEAISRVGEQNTVQRLDEVAAVGLTEGDKGLVLSATTADPTYSRYKAAAEEMIDLGTDLDSIREQIIDETSVALLDSIVEEDAAQALVNKHMIAASEQHDDQSWYENLADFATGFAPGWADLDVHNIAEDFMQDFWPGQTMLNLSDHFRKSSVQEKERILNSMEEYFSERAWVNNPQTKMLILSEITGMTENGALNKNFWTAVEAPLSAFDVASVTTLAKVAFKGVSTAAVRAGSRSNAVSTVKQILGKGASEEVTNDAISAGVLPSILQPQKNFTGAPVHGMVERSYIDDLLTPDGVDAPVLKNLVKTLDDNERAVALERTIDDMRKNVPAKLRFNNKQKTSVDLGIELEVKESRLTGGQIVSMKIGGGSTGQVGFIQPRYARAAANRMGIEDFEVVGEDGAWFIKWSRPVTEGETSGWIAGESANIRHIGAGFRGTDSVSPDRFNQVAHLMADSEEEVAELFRNTVKPYGSLKGQSKTKVDTALEKSRERETWFTPEELKKDFGFDDKEIEGYKAYRRVNDSVYAMDNASVWHQKNRLGFRTVQIENEFGKAKGLDSFDGVPVDDIPSPDNLHFYDASVGESVTDLTKADLDKYKNSGYRIFRLEGDEAAFRKSPTQYVLVKKGDVNVRDLRTKQLRYLEGPRKAYEGDHFIKQASTGVTSKGVPYIKKSKTLAVSNGKDAQRFADGMNIALDAWRQVDAGTITKGRASDIIQRNLADFSDINSYEQINQMITDGVINTTNRVEALRNGGSLSEVNALANESNLLFNAEDLSEANSIQRLIALNGNSYSHRGAHLQDIMGESAPLLDPASTLQRSIQRVSRNVPTQAFKQRVMNEWAKEFKEVLVNSGGRKTASGHFMSPEFVNPSNTRQRQLVSKAKAMRTQVDNVLGVQGAWEKKVNDAFERLGEHVSDTPILRNIKGAKPASFIKSMVFHSKMGLFAVEQVLVQSSALLNATLMGGSNGLKAFSGGFILRMGLRTADPSTIDTLASAAAKMGWTKPEFKAVLEGLKDSKKYTLKHSVADVDVGAETITKGRIKTLLDYGVSPFMVVEEQNRINAFAGATLDWMKKTGKSKVVTDVDRSEISFLADTYAGNMSRVSKAAWQRGLSGVPTQFAGYQARLLESLLNTQLSGKRKALLGGGLIAAWGTSGVFGQNIGGSIENAVNDTYKGITGEDLNMWARYAVKNGGLDAVWLAATGSQQNFHERLGPTFRNNLIFDIATGDKNTAEALLGAGGKMVVDVVSDLASYTAKFWSTLQEPEYSSSDAFLDVLEGLKTTGSEQIKSWSSLRKAVTAWNTGNYLDKMDNVIVSDLTKLDAVMLGLGIKPTEVSNYYSIASEAYDQSQVKKEVVNEVRSIANKYFKGEITYEEFMRRKSIALLTYRDDTLTQAEVSYSGVFGGGVLPKMDQLIQKLSTDSGLEAEIEFIRQSKNLEDKE